MCFKNLINCIYLSMCLTINSMISFSDNFIITNYYRSHHWVRTNRTGSKAGKINTTLEVVSMGVHTAKIAMNCLKSFMPHLFIFNRTESLHSVYYSAELVYFA